MRLDAGSWYDAGRNPERREALLRQLESGRFVEFEALDEAGDRRGLILAEVIGLKMLAASQHEAIVVEPVAAEQAQVLEWAKEHLTAPAALFVVPGPRLGDYKSICDGEDFVVMLVSRIRQVTRAAAEASWAGAALALHSAEAERERPPRRGTVAPPRREVVPPWRAPGPLPRQAAHSADEEEDEYEAPSAEEALDGEQRTLESCTRHCGMATLPWTLSRTCDSACAQRRRAVLAFLETAGVWRQCHLRPGMASLAFLETADLALLEVSRVPAWRHRLCSVPSHPLCQVAEHRPLDETPAPCGPRHLCCRREARSSGSLARARGRQLRHCWTQSGSSELPADWGEKLARAFVERARAVHSGTASEEGLSVREILSLRAGRLYQSRTCTRLLKAAEHPPDLLPPEGKCYGTVTRRRPKRKKKEKRRKSRKRRRRRAAAPAAAGRAAAAPVPAAAPAKADSGFFAPPGTWAASPAELRGWPWSSPTVSSSSRWRS